MKKFVWLLPVIFYILTIAFVLILPSGSGEQFFITGLNTVLSLVLTAVAFGVYMPRK